MYDTTLIWKRIVRSKGYYFLVIVQLLICNALVMMGIDERLSYETLRNNPQRYDYDHGYADVLIEFEPRADKKQDVLPHSIKSNPNILYAIRENVFLMFETNGQPDAQDFTVLRVNQPFFEHYFGFRAEPHKLYTLNPDVVLNTILRTTKIAPHQQIGYKGKNLLFNNSAEFELVPFPSPLKPKLLYLQGIEEHCNLDWSCFVLDSGSSVLQEDAPYTYLKIKLTEVNFREFSATIMSDARIKNIYDSYPFAIELRTARYQSQDIQLLGWMGLVTVFIVLIGLTGIMLILLNKRRQELAITLILGAGLRRIWFQTIAEITLIYGAGLLLSIPFRSYLLDNLFMAQSSYTVTASPFSLIVVAGLMVLNIAIVSSICIWKINRLTLTEVLRG